MEKQFIPYELALELKELGFDEECFSLYFNNGEFSEMFHSFYTNAEVVMRLNAVCAPLWQQAFDWLFQKYSLSLLITNSSSYEDKIKLLDDAIRNIQNNKS